MVLRLPAEWETHSGTWFAWPANVDNWPGKMESVAWAFCEMARLLAQGEQVRIVVNTPTEAETAADCLRNSGADMTHIEIYQFCTFWGWLRDCGPQFIKDNGRTAVVDFRFNAWARYDNWESDDRIPERIAAEFSLPRIEPVFNDRRWVLEGGAIDSNGAGVILTTEECLLDPEIQVRNPGCSRADNERILRQYLGAEQVVWLGAGLDGDDTHGHVDDLCRFVAPATVVAVEAADSGDENYKALADNLERLQGVRLPTPSGSQPAAESKLEIVRLPSPRPVIYRGNRLPASYANFYIGNAAVIVPTFNDPADRIALGILSELFPNRSVVGVYARDLIAGGGSLHCLTMQHPL